MNERGRECGMLSIVIITCNRAKELEDAILSCEEHVSMEREYVIIDNGSTDNTHESIEQMRNNGVMNLRYLKQDHNLGVAGGRNEGYKQAKGEVCYFIDDDAIVVSKGNVLDHAYDFLMAREDIAALGTDAYDLLYKKDLHGDKVLTCKPDVDGQIKNFIGCSHMVKRSLIREKYLYPHNIMYGSEESYLGFKVLKDGYKTWHYSGLKIHHMPSVKTRESLKVNLRNIHINTYLVKKYFLPAPFRVVSTLLFTLRIVRFEQGDLRQIYRNIKALRERYLPEYNDRLTNAKAKELCKMFGCIEII